MANKLALGKKIDDDFKDEDIDEILSKLTPEEIEELNNDIDPDNNLLPPSQRCRDQTKKAPTGKFDREALIKFIEEKSKQEKDWEKNVAFESKQRGKIFNKKREEDNHMSKKELEELGFDMELDTEFEEAFKNATEEELVDLAAVLGFNGMLNQLQYHASLENKEQVCGGFQGVAKSEQLKVVADLPDNDTDIEAVIVKLSAAPSPGATDNDINLNNVRNVTVDQIERLCKLLSDNNNNIKRLECANIGLRDFGCLHFVNMLKNNNKLCVLNLESNTLSGEMILKLLEAINHEESALVELRLSNQQQRVLGVRVEQEIVKLVKENSRLQVLGLDLDTAEARIRVRDHLVINVDRHTRLNRLATAH